VSQPNAVAALIQALFIANYLQPQLDAEAKGTTGYAAVRPKILLGCEMPLPPLTEQRRVVARIEQLAGRIAEARGLRRQAEEGVKVLEERSAEDAFSRLRLSGVTGLAFEDVCERVTVGHVSSMRHAYRDTGVAFLRSQNVRKNRFDPKGLLYIAPEFHAANPKSALTPGDVVIVRPALSEWPV
jgi:hypothetical protein